MDKFEKATEYLREIIAISEDLDRNADTLPFKSGKDKDCTLAIIYETISDVRLRLDQLQRFEAICDFDFAYVSTFRLQFKLAQRYVFDLRNSDKRIDYLFFKSLLKIETITV